MAGKSNPRQRARELIDFTLRRLHPSCSEDLRREALAAICPESYRSGWYAEVWADEVRRALAADVQAEPLATVETTATGIRCGFCGYPQSAGCPLCYEARKRHEESRRGETG
jgi:hypothetical protein